MRGRNGEGQRGLKREEMWPVKTDPEVTSCGTYIQTDDVTVQLQLSLLDDMDGSGLILLHLDTNSQSVNRTVG